MAENGIVNVASQVSGWGMSVPEKVVPNAHFETYLDTSDDWIRERSGIEERHWAEMDQGVSFVAEPAARKAIARANLTANDIDGIVFGTVTADHLMPSAACMLQKKLGMTRGFAFDVSAACSGFIYATTVADSLIARGMAKNVLVIGADVMSSIVNMMDRTTAVLFGDGAGAIVLSAVGNATTGNVVSGSSKDFRGVYAADIRADGNLADILMVQTGSAWRITPERAADLGHCIKMDGREVFKFAVRALADISVAVCQKAGVDISEVDHFISHQANKRILQGMAKQLGIPEENVAMNIHKYGNTSAGTIPILLAEEADRGEVKKGDLVLLSAVGAGITWGAMLIRW